MELGEPIHVGKVNLDNLCFALYIKINSKWAVSLNVKYVIDI